MGRITRIRDERGRALAGMLARDAYERWLAKETIAVLDETFEAIADEIRSNPPSLRERQRLSALLTTIDSRLATAYGRASRISIDGITGLAQVEFNAAAAELQASLVDLGAESVTTELVAPVLSPERLREIMRFPIEGLELGDWWKAQANDMATKTRRAIQLGLVKGEGTDEIVRRIIPPRGSVEPAVWRQARATARTIVRTATTAINAQASIASFEAVGGRVTEAYELITARDARVSKICAAKDGLVFRYDDPDREIPPFHLSCRTTCLPVVNYSALGLKAPGKRSPLTVRSFDSWLRGQPQPVQVDVLGVKRAEWYRDGTLSLRQLIDEDNRVLTLEQLAARLGVVPPPGIAGRR